MRTLLPPDPASSRATGRLAVRTDSQPSRQTGS